MEQTNELINDGILRGYRSIDRPYSVNDYPYGFRLRTSIHYWIESKSGLGDRFCSYTINPKNGKPNKPKCGTYSVFLYMFLNEKRHVEIGSIDAYHMDEFRMRFFFITEKIGEDFITDIQKNNIRSNYYSHVRLSIPYQMARYNEEDKEGFKNWAIETLKHIKTCEFKELVNHADRPEETNPTGEIKTTITTYTIQ